jgi:hypothetical protein
VERFINSGVAIHPYYERLYCCVCGNFYPAKGYAHIISYRRREWYTYFRKLDLQSFNKCQYSYMDAAFQFLHPEEVSDMKLEQHIFV